MRSLLTAAILLLACTGAWAQNKLDVDADFLSRGELRNGGLTSYKDGTVENFASFLVERTRIGLNYQGQGLTARITGQQSGVWGSRDGSGFNVYEAWVQFGNKGLFAKIGRQNLSYDDQRIFGSDDWSMTGMSHDVLKVGYEGHGHKVHLIGAYNQNSENMTGGTFFTGGLQPYKSMETLWYHYDVPTFPLGVSLLLMNIGMQGGEKGVEEETFQQQLYGTYLSYTPDNWSVEAAYYRQGGKEEHGLPIDAWMASVKATGKAGERLAFYGGYDYLSGDEYFAIPPEGQIGMARHDALRGFSSIYGSHHKFYGAMDFFYVTTYVGSFTPGLQNLYAGGIWKPGEKISFDLSYHFLAVATNMEDSEKPLGHEIEFSATYALRKNARLSIGYSFMKGTETMVVLKRTPDNRELQWGWVMLTVTPRFFSGSAQKRH